MADLGQAKMSYSDNHGGVKQAEFDPSVVQQLMFNRILGFVRSLWDERVIITGWDAKTGTLEGSLAGVDFVVNVRLREQS